MRVDGLGHQKVHDLDGACRRKLPVRREALRLDGQVVGVAGDLEGASRHGDEHLRERGQSLLACRLDGLLAGIEEDIVGQLDDEPARPRRHPELARVDHRLELLDEVLEELRARVRRGLCLPQLIESPLCVVERLGQCAPLLEHRVDVLPELLELSPQLCADRRALVESRLQIVIGGREIAQLLGQVLRLLLGVGQLLPEIGLLGLAGLLARFELGVRLLRVRDGRGVLVLRDARDRGRKDEGRERREHEFSHGEPPASAVERRLVFPGPARSAPPGHGMPKQAIPIAPEVLS